MKKLLVMAAFAMMFSAFAYGELRIDIRHNSEMEISNLKVGEGMKFTKIRDFHLISTVPQTANWQKFEFSFTPEEDGRVSVIFQSPGSRLKDKIKPLLIDDVKVTGATFKNGSFETINSKGKPAGWRIGSTAQLVTDGAFEGKNCVKINYGSGMICCVLKVTAGQEIKVSLMAKLAE